MIRKIIKGPGYLAVTEDGILMEYIADRTDNQQGTILLGRVNRLMPGMNCAFVKIGRIKDGYLPLDEESNSFTGGRIRSGENLLLQIKKEEIGEKGAFLTRDITLPGRYVIVMPMNRYIGVSSRIKNEGIRARLKQTGDSIASGRFGLVMRNAAAEAEETTVREEAENLFVRWQHIQQDAQNCQTPGYIFSAEDPLNRLREDYSSGGYETVIETSPPDQEILRQLQQAEGRSISLPNGGNIVIDRCEAMTVVDVNTASFTGCGSKEMTILKTNLEACKMIAQYVRLHNLGGIILIDFIDMEAETDRSLVQNKLAEYFSYDRIKTVIHGWTRLGLMEMTRKRNGKEIRQERTQE